GHLDLQLIRVDEVVDRHAEASRGDLLDRRAAAVAVGVGLEASRILPTLARVGAPTETVHGDRERLVGLARYGAEAHRAGAEAAHDLLRGLYLGERNRVSPDLPFGGSIVPAGAGARAALGPDPQEPAQGRLARRVLVDGCRVLAVLLESGRVAHLRVRGFIAPERSGDIAVDRANSVLDQGDRLGVPHVVLAVATPRIDATHRQKVLLRGGAHPPGARMALQGLDREHLQADTTDARGGAGEVAVDQLPLEPDGLEDLGATVGLDRGDAHLGDRLQEALADRLDRVL